MGFLHASSSFLSTPSQFHLPSLQPHSHSRRITKLHSRSFHSIFTTITMPPPQPFPQIPKLSHTTTHLLHHRSHTSMPFTLHASPDNSHSTATTTNSKLIFITSSLTVALAVANRVLYKLALVPMKQYPFFLAQLTTFGYVTLYSSILYMRYRAGIVTDEMLALPKWRFMAIGALEGLGVATGMSAGAMLPGPAIPILSQTFLVWQLAFSTIIGRSYSFNQIAGCLLVATGVVVAVASGSNADQMRSGVDFMWPLLMIAFSAFQAGASIIKEFVFTDAKTRLKGRSLDIFVVNSLGSRFQAFLVLFFLPFLSRVKGIPFGQLPSYLKSGAGCFLNFGANVPGCDGAPMLPLLYIMINLAFNISVLNVVKISSAVVSSLTVMLSVPISIYILSLQLPYRPEATSLSPFFLLGSLILVSGLVIYSIPQPAKHDSYDYSKQLKFIYFFFSNSTVHIATPFFVWIVSSAHLFHLNETIANFIINHTSMNFPSSEPNFLGWLMKI